MTVRFPCLALRLLCVGQVLAAPCKNPRDPADLGIDLSRQDRCDPLVPEQCLLPFPNDYFTVADRSARKGRRVHFALEGLPKNVAGTPMDAIKLNRSDGFSPGAALLMCRRSTSSARGPRRSPNSERPSRPILPSSSSTPAPANVGRCGTSST